MRNRIPIPEKGDGFILINVNFIAYSKSISLQCFSWY